MEDIVVEADVPVEEVVVPEPDKFKKKGMPSFVRALIYWFIGVAFGYVLGLNFPV